MPAALISRRQCVCYVGGRAAQERITAHMEFVAGWALANKL